MDPEPARTVEVDAENSTERPDSGARTEIPENADVVRSGGRPAEQLAALLARAENGARAAAELAGVRFALMHFCGLQACRHAKGPPRRLDRRTFRHSFLLPDGQVRLLWELEHNTGPEGRLQHAVFTDREDLALAEWQVDTAFGVAAGPPEPAVDWAPFGPPVDLTAEPGTLHDLFDPAADPGSYRHAYTEGDSPEHARRLLRRAANANAPGEDVLRRLHAAIAHDITILTRRSTLIRDRMVNWALYEHAFLLLDGTELSLWEIDHTRTPDGRPVCEVYPTRDAALDTVVRRIEAGG
ncbi:DUF6227 family protein [Streptomyces sp. NBC_01476]|uniref:DUF6227 family protein n=1 Tax=Streptomyces sp. NBC_01476 TaxID=2903881 RepID=UPI002E33714F|nr:DUF6227 family protein [Streptomyces sp. NBC_01476]